MKPIKDPALLAKVREQNCLICGDTPCDPHHVKTRGAGGGDTVDNLAALCRRHHSEIHQIGVGRMSNRYPQLYKWLIQNGRYDILERAAKFANG